MKSEAQHGHMISNDIEDYNSSDCSKNVLGTAKVVALAGLAKAFGKEQMIQRFTESPVIQTSQATLAERRQCSYKRKTSTGDVSRKWLRKVA